MSLFIPFVCNVCSYVLSIHIKPGNEVRVTPCPICTDRERQVEERQRAVRQGGFDRPSAFDHFDQGGE